MPRYARNDIGFIKRYCEAAGFTKRHCEAAGFTRRHCEAAGRGNLLTLPGSLLEHTPKQPDEDCRAALAMTLGHMSVPGIGLQRLLKCIFTPSLAAI